MYDKVKDSAQATYTKKEVLAIVKDMNNYEDFNSIGNVHIWLLTVTLIFTVLLGPAYMLMFNPSSDKDRYGAGLFGALLGGGTVVGLLCLYNSMYCCWLSLIKCTLKNNPSLLAAAQNTKYVASDEV